MHLASTSVGTDVLACASLLRVVINDANEQGPSRCMPSASKIAFVIVIARATDVVLVRMTS